MISSDISDVDINDAMTIHYAEADVRKQYDEALNDSRDLPDVIESPLFQSLRHQSHYFSNVDLFQEEDQNFNYLKYAKAREITSNPQL